MPIAPFSIPAHRTGRADFRHPALRLASPRGARRRSPTASVVSTVGSFLLRLTIQLSLKGPDLSRCLQAHRQSPLPHPLRKRTRSQGPLLRWHYPASTLIRPCPTPIRAAACRDVEAATLARDGSPPITRTTFPTCRAHYLGGSSGCSCRLLPAHTAFPKWQEGRHPHCHFRDAMGRAARRMAPSSLQRIKGAPHAEVKRSEPIHRPSQSR